VNPGLEPQAPLDIDRVRGRAISAAMRSGRGALVASGDRARLKAAVSRREALDARVASGREPSDWSEFMGQVFQAEADIHAGTMGWADESFYQPVLRFMRTHGAPPDAIAALTFVHGVSSYNWLEATSQVDALLAAYDGGVRWLDADEFRDGAVVALLKTAQFEKARTIFNRMAEHAHRKADDVRVRILGGAVGKAVASIAPAADSTHNR
jgi:hypothetical protein